MPPVIDNENNGKDRGGLLWPDVRSQMLSRATTPCIKAYYEATDFKGETNITDVPLLALDLETTGMDDKHNAIVSIGFVRFDTRRIQLKTSVNWLVKPRRSLEKSARFHGITHSDLAAAPYFEERLEALLTGMAGHVVVAHYHSIEKNFLYAAVEQAIGEAFCFPVIDTMALEARLYPSEPSSRIRRWLGLEKKQVSLRLNASRQRYHLPRYRPHHALTDALATAELFQAQLQHHHPQGVGLKDLWL